MKAKTLRSVAVMLKSVALILIAGLALADRVQAQSITWEDQDSVAASETTWFQPKIAGDQMGNFIVLGLAGTTTLGPVDYWTAFNELNTTSLDGIGYGQEYTAGGLAPSIAMANPFGCYYGPAVEVHQGGQRNGAALWSEAGLYTTPIGSALSFFDPIEYDTGYNPAVAADPGLFFVGGGPCETINVVEVHQAAAGYSNLWYHVGAVSSGDGLSAVTWGPAYQVGSASPYTQGNLASVTVCDGTVIEVHEGSSGTLWYNMGTYDPYTSQITWNWASGKQYDNGYAPSVTSVCGYPYVVEVHQADDPPKGDHTVLWYHVDPFTSSSVSWTPAQRYDTGCSPSVAFAYPYKGLSPPAPAYLTETHLGTCGEPGTLLYDYGYFLEN